MPGDAWRLSSQNRRGYSKCCIARHGLPAALQGWALRLWALFSAGFSKNERAREPLLKEFQIFPRIDPPGFCGIGHRHRLKFPATLPRQIYQERQKIHFAGDCTGSSHARVLPPCVWKTLSPQQKYADIAEPAVIHGSAFPGLAYLLQRAVPEYILHVRP